MTVVLFRPLRHAGMVFKPSDQRLLYCKWSRDGGRMTAVSLAAVIHCEALPVPPPVSMCRSAASMLVQRWRRQGLVERAVHGRNKGWVPSRPPAPAR